MKRFDVRYETKTSIGWIGYESENEMYADLEVLNLVEENPEVVGIDYYELTVLDDGSVLIARRWDFGKPYLTDYWRKVS